MAASLTIDKHHIMKLDIKALLTVALIAGVAAFFWFAPSQGLQAAPKLQMTTIDGQPLNSADFKGKPYLMVFWATDCSGCVKEIPHLTELNKEFSAEGFKIVGVAVKHDQVPLIKAMRDQKQMNYPLVHDATGEIAQQFGKVNITPTNFLVSADGKIVYQKMGEFKPDEMRGRIRDLLKG